MEALLAPVLNHLLAQQGWAAARLAAHAGNQATLVLAGHHIVFRIREGGLLEAGEADGPSDVEIVIDSGAVGALSNGVDGVMAHVKLSGNADLADTLSFVARHLRWDREADLARVFGPILGRRLHLTANRFESAVPAAGRRLAQNAAEYLVHEGGALVARVEMDASMADMRRFRDDLARLEQRVSRLERPGR